MGLSPSIHDRLVTALAETDSWFSAYARLRELVPEQHEPEHRPFIWAFGYDLISPSDVDRRAREGSAFGAIFEFAEGRLPPRLGDVPEGDVTSWLEAFDAIDDPRLRSRFGDLLWSRKFKPEPHLKARAACEALIELSRLSDWEPMTATEGLVRAIELGLELSDDNLVAAAAGKC